MSLRSSIFMHSLFLSSTFSSLSLSKYLHSFIHSCVCSFHESFHESYCSFSSFLNKCSPAQSSAKPASEHSHFHMQQIPQYLKHGLEGGTGGGVREKMEEGDGGGQTDIERKAERCKRGKER